LIINIYICIKEKSSTIYRLIYNIAINRHKEYMMADKEDKLEFDDMDLGYIRTAT